MTDFPAQCPEAVDVVLNNFGRQIRRHESLQKMPEARPPTSRLAVDLFSHPGTRPAVQTPTITFQQGGQIRGSAIYGTGLNPCHHFPGSVYQRARFGADRKSIEVSARPHKGSAAICSRCQQPAPGYDQLLGRRFELIPLWGFFVFLLYAMRRVDCRRCGAVVVEQVPWGDGNEP